MDCVSPCVLTALYLNTEKRPAPKPLLRAGKKAIYANLKLTQITFIPVFFFLGNPRDLSAPKLWTLHLHGNLFSLEGGRGGKNPENEVACMERFIWILSLIDAKNLNLAS